MRIALFTIWHCCNFGAEMQAYAMCKVLENMGHEVEIIDINLSANIPNNFKHKIGRMLNSITPYYRTFQKFWKENFNIGKKYLSLDELISNPPEADVYVVGSDQVWNRNITQNIAKVFYLPFGNSSIRRITYASSFGFSKWTENDEYTEFVKESLKKFAFLSCREKSGVNLLKSVFNCDATLVLDPTLLIRDYSQLIGAIHLQNTLSYYPLNPLHKSQLDFEINKIADILGLQLDICNKIKTFAPGRIWSRTSICEWLQSMASSQFVITPSFHGLAFSLNLEKQFAIIQIGNHNLSSRITDLLQSLDLSDRYFTSIDDFLCSRIWEKLIDYSVVSKKLNIMREKSLLYLEEALS